MKSLLYFASLIFALALPFTACQNQPEVATKYVCPMYCEGDKLYDEASNCPVCNMLLRDTATLEKSVLADPNAVDELSIFNLTSAWKTQNDQAFAWTDLKDEVFVMTMIYTSCKAACPRLVADMRDIAQKVGSEKVKYVLVSIDPEVDTPARLKEFAAENQLDPEQWILLNGSLDDVRELSNVVAVKYMRISPLDFSHSNIITLFNADGVMAYQQEGLGVDNSALVKETKAMVK